MNDENYSFNGIPIEQWETFNFNEWFNINSYKDCENLNLEDWYYLLNCRAILANGYMGGLQDTYVGETPLITKILKSIIYDPIGKNKSRNLKYPLSHDNPPGWSKYKDLYINSVRPLNLLDAYFIYESFDGVGEDSEPFIQEEVKNKLKQDNLFFQENLTEDSGYGGIPFDLFNSNGLRPGRVYININFDHPDYLIIEDFKVFIKNYRKAMSEKKQIKINDLKLIEWSKAGVLPYIDITIWQDYMKMIDKNFKKFTDFQIGEKIFPKSEVDPAERIRKTTRPKSQSALSSLESMRLQLDRKHFNE